MDKKLIFTHGNSKLQDGQFIFSLPAGWSCPGALTCLSKADKDTGKTMDGPYATIRCYAASLEGVFKKLRDNLWHNFNLLRQCKDTAEIQALILKSIPTKALLVRIHSNGDFYSQDYFDAWLLVALALPHVKFYSYSKSLNFVCNRLGSIPANFIINASYGGKYDNLIAQHKLKHVTIVNSKEEADFLGLDIDDDDRHAWNGTKSFALMIHSNGPVGSIQAKRHNEQMRASRQAKKEVQ
jgi:hypothetical protein